MKEARSPGESRTRGVRVHMLGPSSWGRESSMTTKGVVQEKAGSAVHAYIAKRQEKR